MWSEAAILRLISDARAATGACNISTVARVTGVSRQAMWERLSDMKERGLVTWTEGVFGSLRLTNEHTYVAPLPVVPNTRTKDSHL